MRGLSRHFVTWALLLAAAGASFAGEPPITTKIEKDTITVKAAGLSPDEKFALVFSRGAASIVGWYDLDRDPRMEVNLAAHGNTNGCALFQNRAEILLGGRKITLFPERAKDFALVESNSVRAIVEIGGRLTTVTGEFPGERLRKGIHEFTGQRKAGADRPRYVTRFTVYPTGRIYIRHTLKFSGRPLLFTANHMILGTAPVEKVKAINEHAREPDIFLAPSNFLLHHGRGGAFRASALLIADRRRYRTDWVGQLMTTDMKRHGWFRSAFAVQTGFVEMRPGEVVWNFMLQIEPANIDSREAARLYVQDYLKPAKISFIGRRGSLPMNEQEDAQLDGFAEGRGCYVASADRKPVVLMRIDVGTLSRFSPAFEITNWTSRRPRIIHLDAHTRRINVHYNAHVDGERLLIQYLGVLTPGVHTLRIAGPGRS